MVGLKTICITFSALAMLSACVPDAKKTTSCGAGETVNVTLRSCVSASAVAANHRPIPVDQSETIAEDNTIPTFALSPATDSDADTLSYLVVANPIHGTLTNCMNKSGSDGLTDTTCTYVPNTNFFGTDRFTYKVNDGLQDSTDFAEVSIVVTAVNDAPVVSSRYGILLINEFTPTVYTFSYTDPENDLATICNITSVTNFTATPACSCDILGVCTATFTPDSFENSAAGNSFSFDYTLFAGATTTSTEFLYVFAVNDDPIIAAPAVCTTPLAQNANVVCTLPTVTNNDSANGDVFTWSIDSTSTCQWATGPTIEPNDIITAGLITGAPDDDDVGTCNIVAKLTDSFGRSVTSTHAMTITNIAPVLTPAPTLATILEDASSSLVATISSSSGCVAAAGVVCLSVDRIKNGTLSYSTNPATSTCLASGSISRTNVDNDTVRLYFTPTANFSGTCSISLTFDDGNTGTVTESGTVTVTEVNDVPTFNVATIPGQTVNDGSDLVVDADTTTAAIDALEIDEGGSTVEDAQGLTIDVLSSNTALIPHTVTNIKLFNDDTLATAYTAGAAPGGTGVHFTSLGNEEPFYLVLTPIPGQSGTATITVTLTDDGVPAGVSVKTFSITVTNKSVVHRDWSNIYAVGDTLLSSGTVAAYANIQLKWNTFTAYNDTISGYLVYRSTSPTGPFLTPLSTTPVSTGSNSYIDVIDPVTNPTAVAGVTNYYYKVKAISTSNGKVMEPNSTYATIHVKLPYQNMALVHRRIVNKSTCTSMGLTSDANNNNRCIYVGPADNYSGFFDIGTSYLVDRYETSCNYTDTGCTGGTNGACIGTATPAGAVTTTSATAIFYNRTDGECYFTANNGTLWTAVSAMITTADVDAFAVTNQTASAILQKSTFPQKPPLVHVEQFKANNYCLNSSVEALGSADAKTLTSRLVHVAAADWSTKTDQNNLEEGAALSLSTSTCNSSEGGNLSFDDGLSTPLIDTWTGLSNTSTPRFVMTGSTVTNNCSSRYGIQDLVGNVEEWNLDRFHDTGVNPGPSYRLRPVGINLGTDPNDSLTVHRLSGSFAPYPVYNPYSFQTSTADSESIGDISTTGTPLSFEFELGSSLLTDFFYPLGLPTHARNSSIALSALNIGNKLNNDYFYLPTLVGDSIVTVLQDEILGVTSGGNFEDGTGAGRYTMRLRSACSDVNAPLGICSGADITATSEPNIYTGFRCMISVLP